jgi:hypothetical protein
MTRIVELSDADLISAYRSRCIDWLACHDRQDTLGMAIHATYSGLILLEQDKRLRQRAAEEDRTRKLVVIRGGRQPMGRAQ